MLSVQITSQQIIKEFGGKLIAYDSHKKIIAQTLLKLPKDNIDYLIKTTWFLSSTPDSYGYTFNGNDIPNKHFIFLSDELFRESLSQIQYTILHEVGHIILKHKNEIGFRQSREEIIKQESEADEFAKRYLSL